MSSSIERGWALPALGVAAVALALTNATPARACEPRTVYDVDVLDLELVGGDGRHVELRAVQSAQSVELVEDGVSGGSLDACR